MVFVLLTLEKHRDGIWVTKLVEALQELICQHGAANQHEEQIQIVAIEQFFARPLAIEKILQNVRGIINRVSDAANPMAFKTTVTLLTAAQKRGIPVFNGPESYTMGANKFCHHLIFDMAGVQSPPTCVLKSSSTAQDVVECVRKDDHLRYPILTKPNAGGFGDGIHRIDKEENATVKDKLGTQDGIRIVQNYVKPADGCIYRVWFLNGRVQCSVKRQVNGTTEDITNGCASGSVCARPLANTATKHDSSPVLTAYNVPARVQQDVKRIVAQIPDAHAGSIEYLLGWSKDEDRFEPLYFDLNLLSTLPLPETVLDATKIWGPDYDPWAELARHVLCVLDKDG